jgi:hypothetical protein
MTMVAVNLIIYAVIAVLVCVIVYHFDKDIHGDDCVAVSIMWPITVIFICILLLRIAFDYIKDIWHDKFSKEMKEYKKSEARKHVEDVLIEISSRKNN